MAVGIPVELTVDELKCPNCKRTVFNKVERDDMMKTTDNRLSTMTDERISELQDFKTKDFGGQP